MMLNDKDKIYGILDASGVKYEAMEHEAVFTMEDIEKSNIPEKGPVCKNLFLRDAKGKIHYLVSVSGDRPIDLRSLAEKIHSTRLSFASAERLEKYLAVTQGSVSPLGILNDESKSVIMVFDESLRSETEIAVHPNSNTATVWLSFDSLRSLIEAHGNEIRYVSLD